MRACHFSEKEHIAGVPQTQECGPLINCRCFAGYSSFDQKFFTSIGLECKSSFFTNTMK